MTMDKDLKKLVKLCAHELDELNADWAVGGATAMAAHGFSRQTKDVDIFIADEVRKDLIMRLQSGGVAVGRVMPPSHYSIEPHPNPDPERRVDLLFPALGVECLGIMAAQRMTVEGMNVPVLPLQHVVAAKLLIDPVVERARFEKDGRDLHELRARGLIDVKRVETVLEDVRDKSAIKRLYALMAEPERDQPERAPERKRPKRTR